ncbi:unnamed protein product [Ostreobium quekettii]|uniref:DUF3067 family protein n=1 Tax=Ostreobium quekettii TaxID=121088 RepID=A0A8S1IX17_9CHLO|nr:unnamed protein product [Ostreobium quekettii]
MGLAATSAGFGRAPQQRPCPSMHPPACPAPGRGGRPVAPLRAAPDAPGMDDARRGLDRMMEAPGISGRELRQLVYDKWGRSYDVRIHKRGPRTYLQVMWKYLEQQSFPLTEAEYQEQLDAVAYVLTEWGAASTVRQGIAAARRSGPGYTGGGGAKAVAIPLAVDLEGERGAEWGM